MTPSTVTLQGGHALYWAPGSSLLHRTSFVLPPTVSIIGLRETWVFIKSGNARVDDCNGAGSARPRVDVARASLWNVAHLWNNPSFLSRTMNLA